MTAIVRLITPADAEQFLALCHQLDRETDFMLLEPGERTTTVPEQTARLEQITAAPNKTIFVAEEAGALVGYLAAEGGDYARNRHCAYLVIGILQSAAGQGLGTRLFRALDAWAPGAGLRRLELTVMTHNTRAVALYRKMGFEIEGERRAALRVDEKDVNEFYMARVLPPENGEIT